MTGKIHDDGQSGTEQFPIGRLYRFETRVGTFGWKRQTGRISNGNLHLAAETFV
jgi:hypothetical protein